jgi:Co/Zn/Cd efflux system component
VKAIGRILVRLVAFSIVLASGALIVWLLREGLKRVFHGTDPSVSSAIAAGVLALVVTLASVLLTRRHERQRAIEEQIRERKAPVYEELIKGMLSLLQNAEPGGKVDAKAAKTLFSKLTPQMITWASDDVMRTWSHWQRDQNVGVLKGMQITFGFESLLQTIRKDLGHANTGFEAGDILRLFVSDLDKHLTSNKPAPEVVPVLAEGDANTAGR